jgi:HEAT repeat protein
VDRIGSKPIFIFCAVMGLLSIIPLLIFPHGFFEGKPVSVIMFLAMIFFLLNFAFIGAENVGQTYFMSLIPRKYMLELGVLYYLVFGIAGSGGNLLAGFLLDTLSNCGIAHPLDFKILYTILFVILIIVVILQQRLTSLGALSVKDSLEVLFSYKDLRAISLLDKLDKAKDSADEEVLLSELYDTPSVLALKGLLNRLKSPRFVIRLESLRALGAMKYLPSEAVDALIEDVSHHPYTSAYYSARILGMHRIEKAIPLLRNLVCSNDYMLAGESMIALARLKDEEFRPRIEETIINSSNPRVKLMGAEALGVYKSPTRLPVLFDIMLIKEPPPYLRDEMALAMAEILGISAPYYKLLIAFIQNQDMAPMLAEDQAESAAEYYKNTIGGKAIKGKPLAEKLPGAAESLQSAVHGFMASEAEGMRDMARWIMNLPDELCSRSVALIMSETIFDDDINRFDRIRLLAAQWAAYRLRAWVDKVK